MAKRERAKSISADHAPPSDAIHRSHEVVNRILALVRSGNLQPGDRLPPERELIEIFAISRPSLREGLRALGALGVIESRHGGGAFVTNLDARRLLAPLDFYLSLTESNLQESFACRQLIEVETVRIAARTARPSDIAALQTMMDAHEAVQTDPVGFRILDSRFHEMLGRMAGNSILASFSNALYNLGLDIRRRATEAPGQIGQSTADHQAIVEAIKAHDEDSAARAMTLHLDHIAESTRTLIAQTGSGKD